MGLLTDLISKVGLDTKDLEKDLDRAHRKMVRSGRRMSLIGNDLTQNISLPLLAMGGYAVKSAADIERLELALKNTMGAGYIDELERLKEIAKDPGLGFEQAVRGSVALQAVGESADSSRKMMQEWGNAVAAAGGTAHNLDRVIVQLQQALSKQGSLLREDWKFIVQQAPQAQKAMMDLYGTGSTEELAKMGVTAKQAIREITNELANLGRVEGGIANKFVNFTDQLKQQLAPLGKLIFESSNLKGVLDGVISTVTTVTKVFSSLSPTMQNLIVKFFTGIAIIGPFMRLMGSGILIFAQFSTGLGKAAISLRKFGGFMEMATTTTRGFSMSLNKNVRILTTITRSVVAFTGALGGIAAMSYGAINGIKGIFREIEKGRGQLDVLREFQGIGIGAYNFQIAQGLDRSVDPKKFAGTAKSIGLVNGQLQILYEKSNQAQDGVGPLISKMNGAPDPEPLSEWGKALQELQKELRGIGEMEKLLGKNLKYEKMGAIMGTAAKGIKEFGKSADDPAITNLVSKFRDLRGEVQGIVGEIPKLNLLPKALAPTGGFSDLGGDNVNRIKGQLKQLDQATKEAWKNRSFRSMDNAVVEGMATQLEAASKIYNDHGSDAAKEYLAGFSQRIRESNLVDLNIEEFANGIAQTAAIGFSDALGSVMGGENPAKAMIEGFLIPITDIIKRFGVMVITSANLFQALKAAITNPIAAIGVGSAAIIASTAAKKYFQGKLKSLAEGGIATGPTAAVVGDNPRSPELITPLHKLPSLMKSIMGGGGQVIRVQGNFDIDGDKLTYFIDEQIDLRKSVSMY